MSRIKTASTTLRASSALPGAGAYDSASDALSMDVQNCTDVEIYISYTLQGGSTTGDAKYKVLVSDVDTGGASTFYERTIKDATTLTTASGEARSPVYTDASLLPTPPVDVSRRTFMIDVRTARRLMVLFAAVTDTGNPGLVACSAIGLVGGV